MRGEGERHGGARALQSREEHGGFGARCRCAQLGKEQNLRSLTFWEQSFNDVGWFIPPYIQMGVLGRIAGEIKARGGQYDQDDLEQTLAQLYEAEGLAAMVMHRYPIAPVIKDYRETIAEAIEAHFFGLNHVAIGGLVPVIEGAGRQLATQRGLTPNGIRDVFATLADDCKQEFVNRNMGAPDEIESMMDSFVFFVRNYMYVGSSLYPLVDKTNRHGITHGAYADADYGRPLNFFKTIAAIDFLALVSSFRANISWLAPSPTAASHKLASYYLTLRGLGAKRVR